jgi:hypothetical protein
MLGTSKRAGIHGILDSGVLSRKGKKARKMITGGRKRKGTPESRLLSKAVFNAVRVALPFGALRDF